MQQSVGLVEICQRHKILSAGGAHRHNDGDVVSDRPLDVIFALAISYLADHFLDR